jgi:hypothetical protein
MENTELLRINGELRASVYMYRRLVKELVDELGVVAINDQYVYFGESEVLCPALAKLLIEAKKESS